MSYGSMNEQGEKLLADDMKDAVALNLVSPDNFYPNNPFSENFDTDFWDAVATEFKDAEGVKGWALVLAEVRLDFISKKFSKENKDVVVGLLVDIFDRYEKESKENQQPELMLSFIQMLTEFVLIILKKDNDWSKEKKKKAVYSKLLKCGNGVRKTVLHLACERNLSVIAEKVLEYYPGQCYIKSMGEESLKQMPVEKALLQKHDDVSSVVIKAMLNERVRDLFEFDDTLGKAKFSFCELLRDCKMKKTVLAILDCLINPDFPFVPVQPGEEEEEAWSKIPDLPMRYHIYFRLLDGDIAGRPARFIDKSSGKMVPNPDFDHISPSGLYLIANCPFHGDIISHPAVRLLIQRKWNVFGRARSQLLFGIYILYLLLMSLAFFLDVDNHNRSKYESKLDKFRAFCEIATLVITICYLLDEIIQMFRLKSMYWSDVFNYFDLLGSFLIILIPIIKWSTVDAFEEHPSSVEWSVASVAYLVNTLRVLKYFPTYKWLGVYVKTFEQIIFYDISKFLMVYCVVLLAFFGSVYLAISAESNGLTNAGLTQIGVFLSEIRALTEGNGFADDYLGSYRGTVIALIMINMLVIIVILSNILIGQLSYRYEKALEEAHLSYDVNKALIITRNENTRFRRWNSRIKNYEDGAYITEGDVINELLDDWERIESSKSSCKGADSIRLMLMKMLKKQ